MKPKLIITGASGFLGYSLIKEAANDFDVYGLYNKRAFTSPMLTSLHGDITNYISLGNLIDDIEPDAVIHLAALADANYCQVHPQESYTVNVEASANLAGICADYNIPFLFSSTDLVFDGRQGMYTEQDEVNPVNLYGEHKALAEQKILSIYPLATVCRLSLMFGASANGKTNYVSNLIQQLRSGQPVSLFHDEYRSIAGTQSVSKGLLKLLGKASGIYHVAGEERLSRYEFGLKISEVFNLEKNLLKSCSQKDIEMAAPRPADVSMDITKAKSLGYEPMSVADELALLAFN